MLPGDLHHIIIRGIERTAIFADDGDRDRRHGHLFQNRYKSILCEEDRYLRQLVAYIHLNPLRAGMVADVAALKFYPFTGHSALMGRVARSWQDTDYVLALFGRSASEARRNLQRHVLKWSEGGRCPELTGGWAAVKETHREGIRITGDERQSPLSRK